MLKKAILKAWYPASYTANIQLAGSAKANLEGVTVARNLPSVEMIPGRKLAVIFWDKTNPAEGVVVGVY
jgi:hypothetical protein